MNAYKNIAVRAANRAGDFVAKAFGDRDRIIAQSKGINDFVSNIDRKAEQIIIDTIQLSYPEHAILAEESGHIEGKGDDAQVTWVIDPIDGTTNFLQGIPHFAISIAVKQNGKTVAAVVFDPIKDEMFSAANGEGAQLNNKRIRVSDKRKLDNAVLATGFPFRHHAQLDNYLEYFSTLLPLCSDMRRAGSAALDLAYVAAGRVDGFWEFNLAEWDTAAGILLVKEAGGLIGDVKGNPYSTKSKSILAANPGVFKHFMQTVKNI
ncbi:MAG: inositol monophosphatase [Kangiellaceae bacterium]|nr:inositol monophosphatase [Kangiellaceae bacterium]